ncbi:hypothetical protein [Bordetella petrii]|uniref:hypothetical protein n=1 Tax=Bordetella petrii TaxID=94624 RepID=UPI00047D3E8E|nr:hypothetical protein [Bordetella petrii]
MTFSADIAKFVAQAKGNIDEAARRATILLAQGVILKSPVDTGRFRGNWMFAVGAVPRQTVTTTDPSGQTTMARLINEIWPTGAGGVTYLSNNLPYAVRLENGWSKQAPQGMVRLTAQEFQAYVSKAANEVRNK